MLNFWAMFVALGVGYLIADYQSKGLLWRTYLPHLKRFQNKTLPLKQTGYYGVLTSLLNEQSDEALDSFVSSMDVNAETLDVHLALGNLLRRRGEYARAVRIHENLLNHPNLSIENQWQVQLELAMDYSRSGLLDRAESVLSDLVKTPKLQQSVRWQANAYLLEIYQDLKQWLEAIDVADCLTEKKFASEPDFWRKLQAQFSCELADIAFQKNNADQMLSKAKQALVYDPECVRAYLLLAQHAVESNDFSLALSRLAWIRDKSPEFLSETLPLLEKCFENNTSGYVDFLRNLVLEHTSVSALLTLSDLSINQSKGLSVSELSKLWVSLIHKIDALAFPESELLKLIADNLDEKNAILHIQSITDYLRSKAHYACSSCGAKYEIPQWRCANCSTWSTVRPSAK